MGLAIAQRRQFPLFNQNLRLVRRRGMKAARQKRSKNRAGKGEMQKGRTKKPKSGIPKAPITISTNASSIVFISSPRGGSAKKKP